MFFVNSFPQIPSETCSELEAFSHTDNIEDIDILDVNYMM